MSKKQKNIKPIKHISKSTKVTSQNISLAEKSSLALRYQQEGEFQKAASICKEILAIEPNNVDANHLLAIIAIHTGNANAAVHLCNKAIKENSSQEVIHNTLGYALNGLDQNEKAVDSYRKALSINSDYTDAHNNLGNALKKLGRMDEAINSYKKALSIRPGYAEVHNNLGNAYNELGRVDEAIISYKKALAFKPGYAEAYFHLSRAVKNIEHDVIAIMEKFFVSEGVSDKDKMFLGFALGKSYEDIKDYEKSFYYYMEGNRFNRESYRYSSREDYNLFEKIKEVFSKEYFLRNEGSGDQNESPIFIIGMPRSGTSLVEQILSSHPLVFGAGELNFIPNMALTYFSDDTTALFPEYIPDIEIDNYSKAGLSYIEKIRILSESNKYITDKMPHNFLFIGLIKSILPNARIIHCMRDPMDTCLSIFKNYFSASDAHKYAYDMGELGRYYNLYLDLMDHWRDVFPDFIYEIHYEDLVKNQEAQTRGLLNYCNLPWDDACLEFYKTKRRVKTASNVQVRNPIYNDSVQVWKRYERQLEPLRLAIYG